MDSEMYDYSRQHGTMKNELYDWVEAVAFAIVCIVLIYTFVARIVTVDGFSMENTLQDGDRLISSRVLFKPSYGDIVIVTLPDGQNRASKPLVKRIVATEGQEVNIDFFSGDITVDGLVYNEPYIKEPTHNQGDIVFPILVPDGCVFVMGDNRNDSLDSRSSRVGMVEEGFLLGRAVYRVTPFNNHGDPDNYWKNEAADEKVD